MLEAPDERLDVEELAQHPCLHGAADGDEVGIPSPALAHREGAVVRPRRRQHVVGLVHGQTQGLLAGDVLSGAKQLERDAGM